MKTEQPLIFIPDFMIVLKELKKTGAITNTNLFKVTGITYSHLHKIMKLFVENGWSIKKRDGKKVLYSITEHGIDIVNVINMLLDKLNINDDNIKNFRKRIKKSVEENVDGRENTTTQENI